MTTELVHQKICYSYTIITDVYTEKITFSFSSVFSKRSVDSGVETLVTIRDRIKWIKQKVGGEISG
ncbi:MAG: hypothetical protein OEW86_02060 [Nitrosopumilus sp.]|nr:hypothetical protein [Nitrosopumilus sp.]MDH3565546.1 hypothetical protein [Nitrosopumilus sp.]MDH5416757.1 hypothetical protein [Nitrosopumilus sp.]MDH5555221.1 hypothetical protein [Nitrosopumilus sp.]